MKSLVMLSAVLAAAFTCHAKVWRVNNNPGITADFTTAQAAHDNVSVLAGDTLHLEPSITSYGNLNLTKKLTVIAVGEFFSANPGVQYSQVTAELGNVSISVASASGSVFHCSMSTLQVANTTSLRIERCYIPSGVNLNFTSNNTIVQNFIGSAYITNSSNNIISNNIFTYYLQVATTSSATITNNVIYGQTAAGSQPIANSTFQNNIINKNGTFVFTNSVVENNIASNTSLPAGNGNVNNVNMSTVFVNASGTTDADFKLQSAVLNPATGAGVNGVDCGPYGGILGFKPALQPAIPAIYKLTAPTNPAGNTMNITFSTKSNN